MKEERINFRVTPYLKKQLKQLAESNDITLSKQVIRLVQFAMLSLYSENKNTSKIEKL